MLIDTALIRFCAEKTREIEHTYDTTCVFPGDTNGGHPRSADDLDVIIMGLHGRVEHKQLRTSVKDAKYRSFYLPLADLTQIFYASGMTRPQIRYYKVKELMQIHLWQESLVTDDVVNLVQNMILRESPASLDLDLGHQTISETLAELSAMQFLFPMSHRLKHLEAGHGQDDVTVLAAQYDIPPFVVQRALYVVEYLKEFFT